MFIVIWNGFNIISNVHNGEAGKQEKLECLVFTLFSVYCDIRLVTGM